MQGEVLALPLSGPNAKKAHSLGFTVSTGAGVSRLALPTGMDAARALDLLKSNISGEQFGPNNIYRLYKSANTGADHKANRVQQAGRRGSATPCQGDRCIGRDLIGWEQSKLTACSEELGVAVIDTDVDLDHPSLDPRRLSHGDFIEKGRTPAAKWHGTGVLAMLAGHEKSGTPGLIPRARFFVASVFYTEEDGSFATDTASIIKALKLIEAFDASVVNMSFAGARDDLVQREIARMSANGVVFVAAGGNEGPNAQPRYPAGYKEVIAVTAVAQDLRSFVHANRGSHIDIAAPGVDIWTAVPGGREGYYSGTSFAAPYVTAAVASIVRSVPRLDKPNVLAALATKDLGPLGRDPIYGRGLLVAPQTCNPAPALTAAPFTVPSGLTNAMTPVGYRDRAFDPANASSMRAVLGVD